ncbi:MAG: hypothetical protein NT085_01090 [candidate division SR1 bacterium]|nr:hypothetical protein [candidate division SR1 bacterium]
MLIKAPIGSGKSFLFFDGPIYGLYKYSSRNILNTKSKEGFIKVICEVNQTVYLITRNIKKGKSKDSCESKLYTLEGTLPDFNEHKPLENNVDIEDILRKQPGLKFDEITFKNETDLQQNLQNFLPPREVIMNTIFLMQDSDNIFELTPLDRLTILKNVFNLMGIDEAKEVLADKKREIRYKIKATTDISKYDEKLKHNIQSYISTFDATKELLGNAINTENYQQFFDERKMIEEKIQITDFSLKDFPTDREKNLQNYIEDKKSQEQKLKHQLETIQKDITQEQKKLKDQQAVEKELSISISTLQKKIENIDEKKIETFKKQKSNIILQQNDNENKIPKKDIWNFITQQGIETDIEKEIDITVLNSYFLIQKFINEGKKGSEEIKNIQLQIKNEQLIIKNEAEKIDTQKKHLEEKIFDQENQLKNIMNTLKELEKNIDTQANFACEKIQEPCPFIKIINKKTFDQLDQQKKGFTDQKEQIAVTIKNLQTEIKLLSKTEVKKDDKKIQELEKQQQESEKNIEIIKSFLNKIQYKEIERFYTEYTIQDKEIKELDKKISEGEQEVKQSEERKTHLQKAIIQKESSEKQLNDCITTIAEKEQEWKKLEQEKEKIDSNTTLRVEKNYEAMKQYYHDIDMLVNEFKEHQLERQKLEEQETILGNLYNIFSKELLLLVLQDHLPILNDIINNYLAQIVDYQISLQLRNEADKVELEAKIIDSKGERDTKSLSGGQRIILKLVRMLAISSYINSPILFLDETINNLDTDTVGKVADMLEDFVKQRDIKFYTITHSQQIQQMDIRDQTIEI